MIKTDNNTYDNDEKNGDTEKSLFDRTGDSTFEAAAKRYYTMAEAAKQDATRLQGLINAGPMLPVAPTKPTLPVPVAPTLPAKPPAS